MTIMRRIRSWVVIAVVASAITAACGGDESSDTPIADTSSPTVPPEETLPEETTPDVTTPEETVPDPSSPTTNPWPVASSLVEGAVADLASTLDVGVAAIAVVRAEHVTWRDGSLGCPVPDRSYTQALVDGYRIELAADGDTYWYHGASDRPPFRCDDPREPAPGGSGDR